MTRKPKPSISLKAYANHRGVSVAAVKKAIKHDRLKKSLERTPQGRYKVRSIEAADKEWEQNTDPSQQRGVAAINARELADGLADLNSEIPAEGDAEKEKPESERTWKMRRERADAQLAELKYNQARGLLVDRAEFESAARRVASEVKTKLLGVPSTAKQRIPTLKPEQILVLRALICEALASVADGDE